MNNGYGRMVIDDKHFLAHRISYEEFRGDPGKLCVLHECDNRLCVNPDHLFLGTRTDNSDDKVKKGRQSRGEKHSKASLKGWETRRRKP